MKFVKVKDFAKEFGLKPMRIYIATRLTNPNPARTLINAGISIRAGIAVAKKGHFPFIPPLDFNMYLMMYPDELDQLGEHYYYECSLAWLDACDAIWVVNGAEDSKGVRAEIKYARKKGIKIYTSIDDIPNVK